jgi:threonine/homoserine/homoserine lactone efflux protein
MSPEWLPITTSLGLYAAVVVSPGPNFALISRLAVSGERSAAIGAAFGFAVSATIYAILSMAGLALVLTKIGWLATSVQIAGGCYLVYLGTMAWLTAKPSSVVQQARSMTTGPWRGLRMGLLVDLSNPKAIAFFIGLYAVAIPPETALWAMILILIGGFMLEIVWYGLITLLLSRRPIRNVYDRFSRRIERAIGTLLIAFGIRLISEKL